MPATLPTESKSKPMIAVTHDIPYKLFNTMGIAGRAAAVAVWDAPDDLPTLFSDLAGSLPAPVKPIGQGSNILFPDGRFEGTILLSGFTVVEPIESPEAGVTFRIGAGKRLDDFIAETAAEGLWGLENLSHIPGTAGAAAVQNVGAYGVEFADCLVAVTCYDVADRRFVTLPAGELGYGYRDSAFKHPPMRGRMIICSVDVRLSRVPAPHLDYGNLRSVLEGAVPTPLAVREAIVETRRSKLPEITEAGSAGSFFKNPIVSVDRLSAIREKAESAGIDTSSMPVYQLADSPGHAKLSAAWLIDRSGLKGARVGSAVTWQTQPLVIVNADGHATSADVKALAEHIIAEVDSRFGVRLTPEVEYL